MTALWRFTSFLAVAVASLGLISCATPPTKVRETPQRLFSGGSQLLNPVKIEAATVVIDARSAFDYSMVHVPHSISMQWSDFCDPEHPGLLPLDLSAISRRLSLAGVGLSTHVVVVGYGLKGAGEEARLAWTLNYLGLNNVQFADFEQMGFRFTNVIEENLVASVPSWKAEPVQDLMATRDEVLYVINHRGTEKPVQFAEGEAARVYRLIDVRKARDYLGAEGFGAKVKVPNLESINIPWKEFFDAHLRPNPEIAERLKQIGITPEQRVLVLSEDGVSSAGVALALRALGYSQAANVPGGLRDLIPNSASN